MEYIKKYLKYVVILVSLNFLSITQVLSAECTDLEISGSNTHVTIEDGVTIDNTSYAVTFDNTTNATLTNNGTIETTASGANAIGVGGSDISTLTNNGTITADGNTAIRQGGTIGTLNNEEDGIIQADSSAITNRTATGEIGT